MSAERPGAAANSAQWSLGHASAEMRRAKLNWETIGQLRIRTALGWWRRLWPHTAPTRSLARSRSVRCRPSGAWRSNRSLSCERRRQWSSALRNESAKAPPPPPPLLKLHRDHGGGPI